MRNIVSSAKRKKQKQKKRNDQALLSIVNAPDRYFRIVFPDVVCFDMPQLFTCSLIILLSSDFNKLKPGTELWYKYHCYMIRRLPPGC